MKKWKRTGSIIHARSGECAPVVCIASSVEHARMIEIAPQALKLLEVMTFMLRNGGFSPDEEYVKAQVKKALQVMKKANGATK